MINPRWALAPFVAITLGLLVACGGDSDDGSDTTSTTTTTQTQTTSDAATGTASGASTTETSQTATTAQGTSTGDGTLDMGSLAANLEDVESFRFDMKMKLDLDVPEGSTGSQEDAAAAAMMAALFGNIEAKGEYVAPDSYHMEMTVLGMHVETIQIGDESWTNDGSGWVADSEGGSFSSPFGDSPADLPFEALPQEQLEGAETSQEEVNGFQTTRYHFDKEAIAALAESSDDPTAVADLSELDSMNLDIWVTEDGIPVKMLMEAAGESEGSQIGINMEFNVSDFNDPSITIERPI